MEQSLSGVWNYAGDFNCLLINPTDTLSNSTASFIKCYRALSGPTNYKYFDLRKDGWLYARGGCGFGTAGTEFAVSSAGAVSVTRASNDAAMVVVGGDGSGSQTKGVRLGQTTSTANVEGVDYTGVASYQPLLVGGSALTFHTAGTTAMSINSSQMILLGSAEVGTWRANGAYVVFGHSDLNQSLGGNYALLQQNDGATYLNAATGKAISFRIANSDAVRVSSSSNLLVGTTTDSGNHKLQVAGGGVSITTAGSTTNYALDVLPATTASGLIFRMAPTGSGNNGFAVTQDASSHVKYTWDTGLFSMTGLSNTSTYGLDVLSSAGTASNLVARIGISGVTNGFMVVQDANSTPCYHFEDGNVLIGDSVATNATDGFLYVPSCAGPPTGTPTTYGSAVPIVADRTNNKLYIYSGGSWVALN